MTATDANLDHRGMIENLDHILGKLVKKGELETVEDFLRIWIEKHPNKDARALMKKGGFLTIRLLMKKYLINTG